MTQKFSILHSQFSIPERAAIPTRALPWRDRLLEVGDKARANVNREAEALREGELGLDELVIVLRPLVVDDLRDRLVVVGREASRRRRAGRGGRRRGDV